MIKNLSILAFLLILSTSARADSTYISPHRTYLEESDSLFAGIDKSTLPFPNLYDRVFPIADLPGFDPAKDTIDYAYISQAFSEVERSHYLYANQSATVLNHTILDDYSYAAEQQGILPLIIMDKGLSLLDTTALQDGRLSKDSLGRLFSVPNTNSPFSSFRFRLAAPVFYQDMIIIDKEYKLQIVTPLLAMDSLSAQISQIKVIDYDSNKVWTFSVDSTVNFRFSGLPGSMRTIGVELYDASHTLLWRTRTVGILSTSSDVAEFINSQPCMRYTGAIMSYEPFQGSLESAPEYGQGEYVTFFAPGHCNPKKIMKPVIISDAWDPQDKRIPFRPMIIDGGENYNDMYHDRLEFSDGSTTYNLVDSLNELGFDVVIVNYNLYHYDSSHVYIPIRTSGLTLLEPMYTYKIIDGGTDYIERNARVFISVIRDINLQLIANGSSEELVILGPSMGGQITRYALTYMEQQYALTPLPEWDHNSRLWVSFDSPHHGANIPLGLQETLRYMGDAQGSQGAKNFLKHQLRAPAARQMLIPQIIDEGEDLVMGTSFSHSQYYYGGHPMHQDYYSAINDLGWPQTRNVSLINGSYSGGRYYGPGDQMFQMKIFAKWPSSWNILKNNTYFTANTNSIITESWKARLYTLGLLSLSNRLYANTSLHPNGYLSLDAAPGGTYDVQDELYQQIDGKRITDLPWPVKVGKGYFPSEYKTHNSTHIPSYSGLALIDKNEDWSLPIDIDKIICEENTPFDNVFAPPINEDHTALTPMNVAWALEEIIYGRPGCPNICATAINSTLAGRYMCGTDEYVFSINESFPASQGTVTWSYSEGLTPVSGFISPNNNSIKLKWDGITTPENQYVKVKITPKIAGAQCGASREFVANIHYGDPFQLVHNFTGVGDPTFTVRVEPNSVMDYTYKWRDDAADPWPATNTTFWSREFTKVPLHTAKYYSVRVYAEGCTSHVAELTGQYVSIGMGMDDGTGATSSSQELFNVSNPTLIPNPTTTEWKLVLPLDWERNQSVATVYASDGRKMYSVNVGKAEYTILSTENLSSGLYIIEVISGTKRAVIKGVKK